MGAPKDRDSREAQARRDGGRMQVAAYLRQPIPRSATRPSTRAMLREGLIEVPTVIRDGQCPG